MPGPYIDKVKDNPVKLAYKEQLMPWMQDKKGGPQSWGKGKGTMPPDFANLSDEEKKILLRLMMAGFGGENDPAYKNFSQWGADQENRQAHGSGFWDIMNKLETP